MKNMRKLSMFIVAMAVFVLPLQGAPVLVYDWDADGDADTAGDDTWESEISTTETRTWTFDKNASPVNAGSSWFGKAYHFGGGAQDPVFAATGSFSNSDLKDGDNDASFEFWLKPDDLSGNEGIFNTGGDGYGIGFALNGNMLRVHSKSSEALSVNQEYDLSNEGGYDSGTDTFNDFIQIVGVADEANSEFHLYVNGDKKDTQTNVDSGWHSGGAGAHLGKSEISDFDPDKEGGDYGNFEGKIARVRFYADAMSANEVESAYNTVIPEPASLGLFGIVCAALWFARRKYRGIQS